MWYKRNEQPLRIAFWYGASGLGSLIGGIVFFGIGHIQGALHPWKYQYLILGSVTVLWGIVIVCFLPDDPIKARFLSADERVLAVKRMQSAQTGISNSVFKAKQVTDTLQDPKTYLLVLTAFTITLINGALSGYGAIIIGSFGYPDFKSVLFSGIPGVVVFVTLITTGYVMASNRRSASPRMIADLIVQVRHASLPQSANERLRYHHTAGHCWLCDDLEVELAQSSRTLCWIRTPWLLRYIIRDAAVFNDR